MSVLTALASLALAVGPTENPAELGSVTWNRNLEDALVSARQTQKPVLLLFQEIPGCQGCRDFGAAPLSHPLLVEAIEDEFVPVAIYNNRGGYDQKIRERFDEPAWNFPVMRFLDSDGVDLVTRRDRIFTTGAVAARLVAALDATDRAVPEYLRLLAFETQETPRAKATFAMHCFWEGEARLGAVPGVVATRAGWQDGREVVELTYDPDSVAFPELLERARSLQCASRVYAHDDTQLTHARSVVGAEAVPIKKSTRDAKASDQKFNLRRTAYWWLPLTPGQATKINGAVRLGANPDQWLSPRQRELLRLVKRGLRDDEHRLDGLTPIHDGRNMAAYERVLRARLIDRA